MNDGVFKGVLILAVLLAGAIAVITVFSRNLRALFAASACETFEPVRVAAEVGGRQDLVTFPASGYLRRTGATDGRASDAVMCGQTLIAPRVAITAAHCVADVAPGDVVAGWGAPPACPSDPSSRAAEISVVRIVAHPGYDKYAKSRCSDDVALVFLADQPPGVAAASLAPLPPSMQRNAAEPALVSIGYGKVPGRSERRRIDVAVRAADDETIVVNGATGTGCFQGGACYGDSGGSLALRNTDTLVGVLCSAQMKTSYGQCGKANGYDVNCFKDTCAPNGNMTFVRVSSHRAWIAREMSRK